MSVCVQLSQRKTARPDPDLEWSIRMSRRINAHLTPITEFDVSDGQAVRMQVSLPAPAVDALWEPLLSIMLGEFGWGIADSPEG